MQPAYYRFTQQGRGAATPTHTLKRRGVAFCQRDVLARYDDGLHLASHVLRWKSRGTSAWSLSALRAQRPPTSCAGNIQRWNHQASLALCPYTAKRLGLLCGGQKETIDWTSFGGQHVWHIWTVESSPWMKSWIHQRYATLCNMLVLSKQTIEQSSTFGCCMLWLRFPAPFCIMKHQGSWSAGVSFSIFLTRRDSSNEATELWIGYELDTQLQIHWDHKQTANHGTMSVWFASKFVDPLRCVFLAMVFPWRMILCCEDFVNEEPKHICMAKQFCATNLIPIDTF